MLPKTQLDGLHIRSSLKPDLYRELHERVSDEVWLQVRLMKD